VFLSGFFNIDAMRKSREMGSFWETYVYHHLRILARLLNPPAKLFFWRTRAGEEVDFILEYGRKLAAFEVKMNPEPGYSDVSGIKTFIQEHLKYDVTGILIHSGTRIKRLDEKIIAIPWRLITG
ncbi:MAG: DUF4143 domain-containing protein, partial [Spirochaetota bacterium]